jgi:prolyl oligopeptidase
MSDDDPDLLRLVGDAEAARAFVARESARAEAALADAAYERDVATLRRLEEDPAALPSVTRRGAWFYSFRRTAEHPRGLWRRIPAGERPAPEAEWHPVFDVDAFCTQDGRDWAWRGAVTAAFDPSRVLLILSLDGSDRWRFLEFDCDAGALVEGGFDVGPQKGSAHWLDRDTLLMSSSEGEDATRVGRPRVVRRLARAGTLAEAPVVFEASYDDVGAIGWVVGAGTDEPQTFLRRIHEIGKSELVMRRADGSERRLHAPPDTWPFAGRTHYGFVTRLEGDLPPGTLVVAPIEGGEPRVVFTPSERRVVDLGWPFFAGDWALWEVQDNLRPELWALDLRDPAAEPVRLPLPGEADEFWIRHLDVPEELSDGTLQIGTEGLIRPPTTHLFDLHRGAEGVRFEPFLAQPATFDADAVEVRMLEAVSQDGTRVPYRLVLPRDGAPDPPVVLYGYGGFAVPRSPHYRRLWGATWIAQGGGYALAHIRGGSEFGPAWHEAARRENRPRAFEDFVAVARDMAARGITRPGRIGAHGASNGGLLTGVMLTRYPEDFGAIWSDMPLLDMLRFADCPAGRAWIDEYGDPAREEDAAWLRAYSPFHQAGPGPYPPAYISTAAHDDRVDPSHARRTAARLLSLGHDVLFHETDTGGHAGGGASDEQARALARGMSFMRRALGGTRPAE